MCSVGQAATISVHPGDDLAAAVAAAAPGDVVEVARGKYLVNLLIDKPLTLRGIDRPTISGGNTGDTIRVTAPDVVLEGLIVSCRIPDDCIDKNRYPLFMARSVLRELIESLPSTRSL